MGGPPLCHGAATRRFLFDIFHMQQREERYESTAVAVAVAAAGTSLHCPFLHLLLNTRHLYD
jgi:hypothetical protein